MKKAAVQKNSLAQSNGKSQALSAQITAPVVVIGGGVMGALAALTLAHLNHSVVWFGPTEQPRADGADHRNYALAPLTVDLLQRLGVWSSLVEKSCKVTRMEVTTADDRVDLSATDAGTEFLSMMVVHHDLLSALETAVQFRPQIQRYKASPDQIEYTPDHAVVHHHQQPIITQLVIGADGARSWVRQQARILWGQKDYEQHGIVAAFKTEHPHANVAAQWFLPNGILALLPLSDEHQTSMVWSTSETVHLEPGSEAILEEKISEMSGHRFGKLSLVGPVVSAPLKMLVTESQTALRTVLLGDAAHTVHPLAGYGLNLGVQDLLALEEICRDHPEDLGANMNVARYEKARHQRVRRVQAALDLLQRLVTESHPVLGRIRQLGLRLVARVGPLRQFLIRQAISPQ
jgi:2-polyprenylphenol 6-hydroxylase